MVIGKGKKCDICYKVIQRLTELYSGVLWKAEFASIEIGYLAEISKYSIDIA